MTGALGTFLASWTRQGWSIAIRTDRDPGGDAYATRLCELIRAADGYPHQLFRAQPVGTHLGLRVVVGAITGHIVGIEGHHVLLEADISGRRVRAGAQQVRPEQAGPTPNDHLEGRPPQEPRELWREEWVDEFRSAAHPSATLRVRPVGLRLL